MCQHPTAERPKTAGRDCGAENRVEPLPDDDVPGYSKPGAVADLCVPGGCRKDGPDQGRRRAGRFGSRNLRCDRAPAPLVRVRVAERRRGRAPSADGGAGQTKSSRLCRGSGQGEDCSNSNAFAGVRHTASTKQLRKQRIPILDNVKMKAYDVWTTNQPVMVFSAEAHMPPPPAGTAQANADAELQYSVFSWRIQISTTTCTNLCGSHRQVPSRPDAAP